MKDRRGGGPQARLGGLARQAAMSAEERKALSRLAVAAHKARAEERRKAREITALSSKKQIVEA